METRAHFSAVLHSPEMWAVTDRHELGLLELYKKGSYRECRLHNDGLKISKARWTISSPAFGVEGVNVHFESRQPGTLQLDVEIVPYEGSIEEEPTRVAELNEQLLLKRKLIEEIRNQLSSERSLYTDFGATVDRLRDPSKPSTLCAMKFSSGAEDPPTRVSSRA